MLEPDVATGEREGYRMLQLRLPVSLFDRIEVAAERHSMSKAMLARVVIRRWLDAEETQDA